LQVHVPKTKIKVSIPTVDAAKSAEILHIWRKIAMLDGTVCCLTSILRLRFDEYSILTEIAAKAAVGTGTGAGADEDDFMVLKRRTKLVEKEETQEDRWNAMADASAKAPGRLKRDEVSMASATKKKVVMF
jgi:hypothetical protein